VTTAARSPARPDSAAVQSASRSRYAVRLIAFALGVLFLGYAAICFRVADEFTRPARAPMDVSPTAIAPRYEDVAFASADGLTMRGWFFPASADRAVVLVHGRNANRTGERSAHAARFLLASGYSVLTFDLRGHGESDGERFSLGYHERKDVAGAIDFLRARGFRESRIALIGRSMGAGTVLQTLYLRPDVGPIIADSSYVHARQVVEEKAPELTGLPAAFNPGIILMSRVMFDLDVDGADPAAIVAKSSTRPFLFIHCDRDTTTHIGHAYELRRHSTHPDTQLWVAQGCEHVRAIDEYPDEYERRVLAFLSAQMR
jgi:pimeloyl-ACP methyl ester carboxylesterase